MEDQLMARIGANVRRLREARGISLVDLGERSGLSRQMLAMVERAESNPSIATLARIAESLGISLASLVSAETNESAHLISPENFKALWKGENESLGAMVVASSASSRSVELWTWRLSAGVSYDAAGELAEEFLLVLTGELSLRWESEPPLIVPVGHALRLPLQQRYTLTGRGKPYSTFVTLFVPT